MLRGIGHLPEATTARRPTGKEREVRADSSEVAEFGRRLLFVGLGGAAEAECAATVVVDRDERSLLASPAPDGPDTTGPGTGSAQARSPDYLAILKRMFWPCLAKENPQICSEKIERIKP